MEALLFLKQIFNLSLHNGSQLSSQILSFFELSSKAYLGVLSLSLSLSLDERDHALHDSSEVLRWLLSTYVGRKKDLFSSKLLLVVKNVYFNLVKMTGEGHR